jgi:hypothetical protein
MPGHFSKVAGFFFLMSQGIPALVGNARNEKSDDNGLEAETPVCHSHGVSGG